MEEIKATAAQEPAEDQEESLILKFRKPYMFEGKEYTEVDLSAMEDMTAEDLCLRQAGGVFQGPAPQGGH